MAVSAHVSAENATKEDLDALENRLVDRIGDAEGGINDHTDLSNAALSTRIDALEALIGNLSVMVGNGTTVSGNVSLEGLIAESLVGAIDELRMDVEEAILSMEEARNETFEDHVNIYRALVGEGGEPLLPQLQEDQERMVYSQMRVRGDMDAFNDNVTAGFNSMNTGNEATFSAADSSDAKTSWLMFFTVLLLVSNLGTLSYASKRPRRLWDKIDYEKRKVENRGGYVEPPCPASEQGKSFGEFHGCPFAEECEVAEECRIKAIDLTEKKVMAGGSPELTPDVDEGDLQEPEEEEEEVATPSNGGGNGLTGFGA